MRTLSALSINPHALCGIEERFALQSLDLIVEISKMLRVLRAKLRITKA